MPNSVFCLDDRFSTTRCTTRLRPEIINNPEDQFESVLFLPPNPTRSAEGGLRTQGYFKQNTLDNPLISVITVVFNGEKYLEQTIKSVIEQSYDHVEYIIIDGGSTDGTLDIIKSYEGQIDYWVSEKDEGIYDAMNKGISVVSGEWINFMNSGDFFKKYLILSEIFYSNLSNVDMIYGDHEIRYATFNKTCKAKNIEKICKGMVFCHQSMFVRRFLQLKYPFNYKKYQLASDFDFIFQSLYKIKVNALYKNLVISSIESIGLSNQNIFRTIYEYSSIVLSEHKSLLAIYYFFFRFLDAFLRESVKYFLPTQLTDLIRKKI